MQNSHILLILAVAIATYLLRMVFLVFFKHVELPRYVKIGLDYLPVAMLTTLIVPSIFMPKGELDISLGNVYIFPFILTILVMLKLKKSVVAIVLGMVLLIVLKHFC